MAREAKSSVHRPLKPMYVTPFDMWPCPPSQPQCTTGVLGSGLTQHSSPLLATSDLASANMPVSSHHTIALVSSCHPCEGWIRQPQQRYMLPSSAPTIAPVFPTQDLPRIPAIISTVKDCTNRK